jgi:hypothetical protein
MLRAVLAVLAFFAFSQTAGAGTFRPPAGKEKAYTAYKIEARRALSALCHTVEAKGSAEIFFVLAASGKLAEFEIDTTDDGLKARLEAKLSHARLPAPPTWVYQGGVFHVRCVFH